MESFSVTNLDVSDINESDLQETPRASYIKNPGRYDLRITSHKMGIKATPDGAGKKWGWLAITAEDRLSGELVNSMIDVPIEALAYTSKAGKKNNIKTKIFVNFLRSLGVTNTALTEIGTHVNNLSSLLGDRPEFTAVLGNDKDYIAYRGKDAEGNNRYGVELKGGGSLLDEDGIEVIRNDFNEMKEYYKSFKGFDAQTGLVFKSFVAA